MASLYDQYGGMATLTQVVDLFYQRVLASPRLSRHFEGMDVDRIKRHQTMFVAAVMGGPPSGIGDERLHQRHAPLSITPEDFGEVAAHLQTTLETAGVAPDHVQQILGEYSARYDVIVTARAA